MAAAAAPTRLKRVNLAVELNLTDFIENAEKNFVDQTIQYNFALWWIFKYFK